MSKNLHGSKRKDYKSSGKRKARALERAAKPDTLNSYGGFGRRKPATANKAHADFLKIQARDRFPSAFSGDIYFEMSKDRKNRPTRSNKPRPSPLGMPLLESLAFHTNPACVKNTAKLLLAASLKIKRVKRHPGWFLERVYNLKDRPIEVI